MKDIKEFENKIICGDCLEIMKEIPDNSVDCVITDPPYGIGKAEWDEKYPKGFEKECLRIAKTVAIMCGMWAIPQCIKELKDNYLGMIAMRNLNGMTFSPLGFGNWIPVIIAGERPKSGQDYLEFSIREKKPNHPSPKQIECMKKLIDRISNESDIILDPFLGSGTTAVACKQLNRHFIGIEINPEYCKIAEDRLKNTIIKKNDIKNEKFW